MPDLPHLVARFCAPLVIARQKIEPLLPVLLPRLLGRGALEAPEGERQVRPAASMVALPAVDPAGIFDRRADGSTSVMDPAGTVSPDGQPSSADRIAIIPVFGTLVARGKGMIAWSGQTSYEALQEEISAARADARVAGILLDVDSPGGEATGILEFGRFLAAVNRDKPVWALAQHWAFSGAYWIASQAGRILATPSAELGSIGVYMAHVDISKYDEQEGFKWTFVVAGDHKVDGNSHEELPARVRARMQDAVDDTYAKFVDAVAEGRAAAGANFDAKAARGTKAETFDAEASVKLGLADAIATQSEALAAFAAFLTDRQRKELTMTDKTAGNSGTTTIAQTAGDGGSAAKPPAGNVVDINAARAEGEAQGRAAAIAYVNEINEICTLAGVPEKARAFIEKATPAAEVRKALIDARAAASDATAISGQHGTAPQGSKPAQPAINTASVYERRRQAVVDAQRAQT